MEGVQATASWVIAELVRIFHVPLRKKRRRLWTRWTVGLLDERVLARQVSLVVSRCGSSLCPLHGARYSVATFAGELAAR